MSAQLDEIEKVRAYMLLFVKDIIDSLGVLNHRTLLNFHHVNLSLWT